jgi:Transposase, Mutator family
LCNYDSGLRNGFRARTVQTAEGELELAIPQVREAAETFASKLFPRGTKLVRTEPLKALVVGAFVRGLSMRDVESLCEQAGLGTLSKSTAHSARDRSHASNSSSTARRMINLAPSLASADNDSRGFSPTPTASSRSICSSISADGATVRLTA